ncbi:MAG: hypothetical protein RQ922_04330 [Thermoproteota archaeon]|nr:hypothetical protein [Thermoproteota archaeon]
MKYVTLFIVFLLVCFILITPVHSYTVSVKKLIAEKIINELPYEWSYSINSYLGEISRGIQESKSVPELYFIPENNTGNLLEFAVNSYNSFVKKLDEGNIKEANYELGKFISYLVDLSNPFRIGKNWNNTLALKFEALVLISDVEKLEIDKNYKAGNIKDESIKLALFAKSKIQELNVTNIEKSQRDSNYEKVVKDLLQYVINLAYSLTLKAIEEHKSNVSFVNLVYILVFAMVISVLVYYINKGRIGKFLKK